MIWFVERLDRFIAERRGVAALAAEVDWLADFEFSLDGRDSLLLRFAVVAAGRQVKLELRYPRFYPDAPPEVVPLDRDLRLADHQWAGGSLCLEHRADNWRPEITGADMVRSAHALLAAETETPAGARGLPSAHDHTFGQMLRATTLRHLYSEALIAKLKEYPPATPMMATMRWDYQSEAVVSWIETVETPEGPWQQAGFPDLGYSMQGVALWVGEGDDAQSLLNVQDADMPRNLAERAGADPVALATSRFVFVGCADYPRVMWRVPQDNPVLGQFVSLPVGGLGLARATTDPRVLFGKKVAVVGCGSVGSKIAVSLARAGVGSFLLIDDDVFMRRNLVRNDLDWQGVGEHKVHALGTRLKRVNPDVVLTKRAIRLMGQEASSSVDSALESLSDCDLVVDTTANADAFNLISAVATRAARPLVWLEVNEGGVGGMVGRYRPGRDATPKDMRSAYLNWCRDRNAPWLGTEPGDYASRDGEGRVLAADDADVGVVAGHAARFALDALIGGETFPYSIYVIGLRAGWIFNAPFDVHPVAIENDDGEETVPVSDEDGSAAIEFLQELLAKRGDEDCPA